MIRKHILLLFALVGLAGTMNAQNHITLDDTYTTGTLIFTASGSITLAPGFEASPGSGHSFEAKIVPAPAISVELQTAPTSNRNYIITYHVRKPGITDPTDEANLTTEVNPVIRYLDGLGRPEQTIRVKASPGGRDIVQHITYDDWGRETKKYLPYSAASDISTGKFKVSTATAQDNFYDTPAAYNAPGVVETDYPFAETVLESSPLNRVLKQGAPGASWQTGSTHTLDQAYSSNATNEVKKWTISSGAATSSYYTAGTLYKTTITDENESRTIEFKDKNGRVVLKQAESATNTFISTYYVYDAVGNLRYVIPPAVSTTFLEGSPAFQQYIYAYHYDDRRRLIEKKIPGKGWEELLYNKHDQVVMTRDTLLKKRGRWLFTKYDALGRVVLTGITDSITTSRSSWQTTLNAQSSATFVSRDDSNGSSTGTGYTDAAYPAHTDVEQYHTMTYYDDYKFYGGSNYSYAGSRMTRGLPTGTKVNILGTNDFLFTKNYYDDKGRAVKIFSQHYKSASIDTNKVDAITNTYDFTGAIETSKREHFVSSFPGGSPALTLFTKYEYDHTGRKRNTKVKINSQDTILLSQLDYNEIGELSAKKLHSPVSAPSFLQTQAYTYNERGWLKTSSAPLFAMELKYNDGTTAKYNGNITNQNWGIPGSLSKGYTYNYDLLNRLVSGISSEGLHEKSIVYDVMGNITGLRRYSDGSTMTDRLRYEYSGNRLIVVEDTVANAINQMRGESEYEYDGNGNMTLRENTNGSYDDNDISISYNILNLPSVVTTETQTATYTYDATGRKLRKVVGVTGSYTREYINGIEYVGGSIESVQTEEGRAVAGSPYSYEYSLKDHLGNSRLSFDNDGGIARRINENDYYPFGLTINTYAFGTENNYLYNNKELQKEFNQLDYGARFYDPVIGRMDNIDPHAEGYRRLSGYAYGADNPMRFTDPDGMDLDDIIYKNRKTGKEVGRINAPGKDVVKTTDATNLNELATNNFDGPKLSAAQNVPEALRGQGQAIYNARNAAPVDYQDMSRATTSLAVGTGALSALAGEYTGIKIGVGLVILASRLGTSTTGTLTRAFFSGAGTEARALDDGYMTLGVTRAGQNLDNLIKSRNIPWSEAEPMWDRLSRTWAKGVPSGSSVPVYLNNPRPGATFLREELPILQNNGVNLIYK